MSSISGLFRLILVHVARLDPDMFDDIDPTDAQCGAMKRLDAYEDEADEAVSSGS